MNSFEQEGFIGPERRDAEIGWNESKDLGKYGAIDLASKKLASGEKGFEILWENTNGDSETLYEGSSYLDAQRILGYAAQCISKNFERNLIPDRIAAYRETFEKNPSVQFTQKEYSEDRFEEIKQQGENAQHEGKMAYESGE